MPIAALVLYLGVLSAYSVVPNGTPGTAVTERLPGHDLTAHGLGSAGLVLLLWWALTACGVNELRAGIVAVIFAATHAGAVELVQHFLPWRTGSLGDLAAGASGVVLAGGLWLAWRRLRASLSPSPAPHETAGPNSAGHVTSRISEKR